MVHTPEYGANPMARRIRGTLSLQQSNIWFFGSASGGRFASTGDDGAASASPPERVS
jgi:hypothetical protein